MGENSVLTCMYSLLKLGCIYSSVIILLPICQYRVCLVRVIVGTCYHCQEIVWLFCTYSLFYHWSLLSIASTHIITPFQIQNSLFRWDLSNLLLRKSPLSILLSFFEVNFMLYSYRTSFLIFSVYAETSWELFFATWKDYPFAHFGPIFAASIIQLSVEMYCLNK